MMVLCSLSSVLMTTFSPLPIIPYLVYLGLVSDHSLVLYSFFSVNAGLVSSSMVGSKPIVMVKDDNCSSQVEDQLQSEENKVRFCLIFF